MKNLLSKSLSKKKWAVIFASLIVTITASGFLIFEMTKKTVALTLDGEEQTINTHAKTIQEIFDEMDIGLRSEDYVYPSVDKAVKDNMEVVWNPAVQVKITDKKDSEVIWTTADTVQELIDEENIELSKHDVIKPKLGDKITGKMDIKIDRAFKIELADGANDKTEEVWSTSTTVADFLSQQDIKLGKLDRVEPKLDETVKENDVIKVIRVEKVTDVVEEPIEYAVVTKKDDSLKKGSEKVLEKGQDGLLKKEFEITRENGKEISRKLLSEEKVKESKDHIVAVGTKVSQPVTKVASRGETNESSGKEMYVSSTAYTAGCNGCSGVTATGLDLKANPGAKVIAVDPSVIPLGTKVYVEGYGYAVASDTGSAIKGNKIDVFFSSKSDAYRWGRKQVKIRVLN
ncbi:G5 and 3D domain-containing protein [Cytobacillus kochii]|uniref:G5 and 3D domain-containing protein n=1 Tax=Cytobacillus kochii TaxID=859143 RepID=UPI001CD42CFE|nr:G5 and 3D domain-containing protein [Cytobacillus kochii]MCA1029132.1 ubiquitin-like domain-containing protein [Cytobacillus kochii]MCM3324980.1 ubiquitin-like domain-containing protein [Cytobacillus kochii]MCM3347344.1 ubiquitin-like domain-containing protein [Cytobacillus kochii]